MKTKKFKLWHLFLGAAGLLLAEAILLRFIPGRHADEALILLCAIFGAVMNLYVSIEAIEEVKSRTHLLAFLSLIVLEFIVFFAFEYRFLLAIQPSSFPTLAADPISLLLHSTMIFIFNPLYLPGTIMGRVFLIVNTFGALGLVLFILQNVWQLRSPRAHESKN